MKLPYLFLLCLCCLFACQPENKEITDIAEHSGDLKKAFSSEKWKIKQDDNYPYREKMLESILYTDTIRNLSEVELLNIMGEPNKVNEGHYYYTISQKKLGIWPLHTRTLVIKLRQGGKVDWIKLHE